MQIALVSTASKSGCPPIGLVYLASYIQNHTKYKVDIIDFNYQNIFMPYKFYHYDLIGISAMTVNYAKAIHLAKWIKSFLHNIPIIIGGVHISTCPESFNPVFDSMVIGEGERAFMELLYDLENNRLKKIYQTEPVSNLDSLALPNWDLIDNRYFKRQFNTTFAEWGIEGWLLTARGCPYKCVFCATTQFWNKMRFHTDKYIIQCIEDLKKKNVTHIQIWDDLFTIDKIRIKRLSNYLNNSDIKYNCQPRINLIDDELCQTLKDSHITLCIFGFESGNTRVLQYLKNDLGLTIQRSKEAVKLCRKYNLDVQGSVMFGSPTETLLEMLDTLKFMLWCWLNGVQRLWAFVATPFPKTEFAKYIPSNINWDKLSHYTKKPILLDKSVKLWQFRIIMFLAHRIEDLFKLKKLWKILKRK